MNAESGASKPAQDAERQRQRARQEQEARQAAHQAKLNSSLESAQRDIEEARKRRQEAKETVTIKVRFACRFLFSANIKLSPSIVFRKHWGTIKCR